MARKRKAAIRQHPPDLNPEEIREIRERLGLSQAEAGELLGGGPRAFTKYETGTIKPAASVANILRLLDANPAALSTLSGRKTVPIDSDGGRPFEVTGRHVEALTDRKLMNLTRRLLAAEAQSSDLPMDGIHVAATITAPDGGEDARIEWSDGPARTANLPERLSQFQLKASEVSPAQAAAEVLTSKVAIKPMVRSALEAGGAYVMLCSRSYTKSKILAREENIYKMLVRAGMNIKRGQVQFRDADQIALWVNAHPPVAAWVLEQTQPGLIGPFRDWTHWAGRHEHESSPWVPDPRLAPFREKLRGLIARARCVARVVGLSGVGKSRLVLEALGPTDEEEAGAPRLSDLVLYTVESEAGTTAVKNVVQNLADAGVRAVVVVDRCIAETHQDLGAMVKRSGSRLSLVTIDHEVPPGDKLADEVLKVDRADGGVIEGMIKQIAPNLPSEDHRRLLAFAQGFPQMATLLGQSWLKAASIASATDDELFDRIILGRKPSDQALLKDAGMLLGAFGLLGAKVPLTDLETVAFLTRGRTADDLHAAFQELAMRGVVQQHGRLISLQPKPLAMALGERQWRNWSASRWDEILAGSVSKTLRTRAAHQLAMLNDRAIASDVARHVCRFDGPLASLDALMAEGSAEVISRLAEIDSEVVANLLERLLGPLSPDELKGIDGDVRRHLVWALEKTAFVSGTFEQGARLLLALAAAENETWGNNATGQFKSLFPVFLGNTEAGAELRLRLLDTLIDEDDPIRMAIVVDALLEGASTHPHSRTVGSEIHGSRPALKPWQPKLWKDVWDYIVACLDRLAQTALRSDAIGVQVRKGMGHQFRSLVSAGLIDRVEGWVTSIAAVHRYWPEALESLGDVLQYDGDGLEPVVVSRVQKLIARLNPNEIADRVRFLVTEMPWDYPVDEKLEFKERGERQVQAIEELARDLLKQPHVLLPFLAQLSVGQQRMAYALGRALALLANDPLQFEEPIKSAFAAASAEQRNFTLLVGYYSGLAERHLDAVEAFKREAVVSSIFASVLPAVCGSIGITGADVRMVCEGMSAKHVPPFSVSHWAYGGVLSKLPAGILAPLFDLMLGMDEHAYSVALDLIGMYVHGQRQRLEELRPQLKLAVRNVGLRPKRRGSRMDAHHFKEMIGWLLAKGWDDPDARSVALMLAKHIADNPDSDAVEMIQPLLPAMLSKFAPIVWPVFGQVIVADKAKGWYLEHSLGDSFTFEAEKNPAVLKVPEDILFAWCHAHPDAGPAFLAGIVPVLTTRREAAPDRALHPIARRLLDEFGEREDVLRKFSQNMHTFGWRGSRTTYYALYETPLRALEAHPIGAVRRWAAKMLSSFSREIEATKTEEAERAANWGV
jgi:DNA-binding transcriptional regulator YiaG